MGFTAPTSATSLALLSIALVLFVSSPGVNCSRARRRYPSPPSTDSSPSLAALTRKESSIPGVSIWTSKKAADLPSRAFGGTADVDRRGTGGRGVGDARIGTSRRASCHINEEGGLLGDCKVGCLGGGVSTHGKI